MVSSTVETEFLNLVEAGEFCRVAATTVRSWIKTGWIPGYMTPGGKVLLVRRTELVAYMRPVGAK